MSATENYCPACEGSGVEVYATTVYEPGCYFAHDSSDERPCRECWGSGKAKRPPGFPKPRGVIDADDDGPWF